MSKELVISAAPHETRVAIVEDGQLCEIYVEREKEFALVGSIYKGRVTRVLPGMQSAFVDIGLDTDAFLYVSDFIEGLEEYDQVSTVETKVQKMEQDGGAVFTPEAPDTAPLSVPEPVEPAADSIAAPAESMESSEPAALETEPDTLAANRSEDLPGESRAQRPANAPPPEPSTGRRDDFRSRGRFGAGGRDRGRGGRGGRDRFGGGGGGRGRGGRDGRDNRDNRGNRPGRDFPSSKYASTSPHRPYEPPSSATTEAGATENLAPIILPGESLSKYKGRDAAAPRVERAAEANLQIGREPAVAYDELHAEAQFTEDHTSRAHDAVATEPTEPSVAMDEPVSPARQDSQSATHFEAAPSKHATAHEGAHAAAVAPIQHPVEHVE
ncbi:MAG: hypothetical protein HY046_08435, partial [Acidobacteria bacterium]|nr:hypothetical protein [Acidobacteriota bacterium]